MARHPLNLVLKGTPEAAHLLPTFLEAGQGPHHDRPGTLDFRHPGQGPNLPDGLSSGQLCADGNTRARNPAHGSNQGRNMTQTSGPQ